MFNLVAEDRIHTWQQGLWFFGRTRKLRMTLGTAKFKQLDQSWFPFLFLVD